MKNQGKDNGGAANSRHFSAFFFLLNLVHISYALSLLKCNVYKVFMIL